MADQLSGIQCPGCIPLYNQRHEISQGMSALLQEAAHCAHQAAESNSKAEKNAQRVEILTDKMTTLTIQFTAAMAEQSERLKNGSEKFTDTSKALHELDNRVRALEGPGKAWWPATLMAAIPTFISIVAWLKKP